jgi:ribonuclease Y
MEMVIPILAVVVGLVIGFVASKMYQQHMDAKRHSDAEDQVQQLTQNAQREAENLVKEAKIESKDLLFQAKSELQAK